MQALAASALVVMRAPRTVLVLRSSPRQRCQALAQRLHALRPDLVLQPPEAWLAEMDLGDWEGRLWTELPEVLAENQLIVHV